MKAKNFTFAIATVLSLVFLISFASASTVLEAINTAEIPLTINHGESIIINLDVEYSGDAEAGKDLTWEGSSPSDEAFWILPTLTHLSAEQTLPTSFTFSIPENYQPGLINAVLGLQGQGLSSSDDFEFSITVNEATPELSVTDATLNTENTAEITIKNEGNNPLTGIELTQAGDFTVTLSETTIATLAGGAEQIVTVTMTTNADDLNLGSNTVTITATADNTELTTASGTVSTSALYCEYSNPGNLKVKIEEINVINGFGDDDDYWYLMDEIEVELEIQPGTWDIEDIEIEWELYTTAGVKIMDGDESDFDLDEDDSDETITFTIKLDEDLDDFEGEDAVLYVRATGKIDDDDANDDDNTYTCAEDAEEYTIISNDDFVIATEFKVNNFEVKESGNSITVPCGATDVQISAEIWNVGDSKQKDVYVLITNEELGINLVVEMDDIKKFDSEKLELTITIPEDAEEKEYALTFTIYDDDNDIYETKEEEDKARFVIFLSTETGTCKVADAEVVATLASGGKAGKDMVIKATITNTGNKMTTFDLNVLDFQTWASSAELDQSKFVLNEGDSKEVLITFAVNKDAKVGEQIFKIEVNSNDKLVKVIGIPVEIEKAGFGFPSITGNAIGSNWYLWGIGALNVLLVIIIIVVALRIAKN